METLRALDFVAAVELTGSRKTGAEDAFSDFDLSVTVRGLPADQGLARIASHLKNEYRPLWLDYANSLMPGKFLVSIFFAGENPFAFYDIGVQNHDAGLLYDSSAFRNDPWVHLTKLWILNFKHYLRRTPAFPFRFAKMMETAGITGYSGALDGFSRLLALLESRPEPPAEYLLLLRAALDFAAARHGRGSGVEPLFPE